METLLHFLPILEHKYSHAWFDLHASKSLSLTLVYCRKMPLILQSLPLDIINKYLPTKSATWYFSKPGCFAQFSSEDIDMRIQILQRDKDEAIEMYAEAVQNLNKLREDNANAESLRDKVQRIVVRQD